MSLLWILLTLLPVFGGAERFNCRGRILGGYYADAKSGCKAFHVCVKVAGGGIRDFRFFCPPGTLFHQEAQTCTDWGDDDPLACPADIYDGQFDLYKIGSGYDTKKLSSAGNRVEESDFGLQRAETSDRRSSQNNPNNAPASDLRAAHSSDFFSGQRERGRDDFTSNGQTASSSPPRQSFRRSSTVRITPPTTQYTTIPPPPQPSNPPQYDYASKRKLVRKRPVYTSTQTPPPTFPQNTPKQYFPQQKFQSQQNYDRKPPANRQSFTSPPANVPPQYKDEYVEVSKVSPKQNKYFIQPSPASFSQTTPVPQNYKKEGFGENYNFEAQSTPGLNVQKENRGFRLRNSFNVVPDVPREQNFSRTNNFNSNTGRFTPTVSPDYSNDATKTFTTSTPVYKNPNSVAYEPEKNNFVPFAKQNYYNSPTTVPTTSIYTTTRSDATINLNTVAYNTNIGFNAQQNNYAESEEDDGQYRPPPGEDDGQYKPEIYDRELLSGAHSLNIAASGNRLPEDQKPRGKTQQSSKSVSQTAAPRPFRPAPVPTSSVPQTTRAPETTYSTTTARPQTVNTQRAFDYFQSYTTTVRPSDHSTQGPPSHNYDLSNNISLRPSTVSAPKAPEIRHQTRAPAPPTTAPVHKHSTRPHHYSYPSNKKEDSSYDYAYYDSDPGFSEYDHIEEFGKTKKT